MCAATACLVSRPALACAMRGVSTEAVEATGAPIEGRVVQAFSCKDAAGEHLFVEARQPAASPAAGSSAKAAPLSLSFYKYTLPAKGLPIKRWQARDFAPQEDALALGGRHNRQPRVDRFVAQDVDGDGLAEAFVSYTLPGQGLNPDNGKLLVFYKDRKYAIRGAVATSLTEFSSRTVDPGFSALPVAVQAFALNLWDAVAMPKGHSAGVLLSQARAR